MNDELEQYVVGGPEPISSLDSEEYACVHCKGVIFVGSSESKQMLAEGRAKPMCMTCSWQRQERGAEPEFRISDEVVEQVSAHFGRRVTREELIAFVERHMIR